MSCRECRGSGVIFSPEVAHDMPQFPTARMCRCSRGENYIHPSAVIYPNVILGSGNWIGAGVVIGGPPEHRDHDPNDYEYSVLIGDGNRFHEYVVIQSGTVGHTVIEDHVMLMHGTHVAHDCLIESNATLSPSVQLAGHVRVGFGATVGMGATVHQRRTIGEHAMVGMGSVVSKDVPRGQKWYGNPARGHGLNREESYGFEILRLAE